LFSFLQQFLRDDGRIRCITCNFSNTRRSEQDAVILSGAVYHCKRRQKSTTYGRQAYNERLFFKKRCGGGFAPASRLSESMMSDIQPAIAQPAAAAVRFEDFGLAPDILRALADQGYVHPTPIQAEAIPIVLQGRDVMGAAQTGTGKTAGFSLPIIQRLLAFANTSASPARHPVRALILTPTRELADQVADNVKAYSRHTPLRSAVVFGGVDMAPQTAALRAGVEVLIATPGRLLDHV